MRAIADWIMAVVSGLPYRFPAIFGVENLRSVLEMDRYSSG